MTTIPARIKLRSGLASAWASANPVLLQGEAGYETDTNILRIGDGVAAFNALPGIQIGGAGFQPLSSTLTSIAALGTVAGRGLYTTAPNVFAEFTLSAFARTFLDDADEATVRATLGITDLLDAKAPVAAKHTIWLPAGAFTPVDTNGAAYASRELPTNDVMIQGYDFSASVDQKIQTIVGLPKSWNAGTLTFEPHWTNGVTAGTGSVIWGGRARAVGNDDALDQAFGTAVTVTDAFIANNDYHIAPESAAMTAAGSPAKGKSLIFEIYRDADAGGDTYNQLARLIGVKLFYTTDAGTDA